MTLEKKTETQFTKRQKELDEIKPEKDFGAFYKHSAEKTAFKLYDLDEDVAFKIVRDYLFRDRYYVIRRKIDLWVRLAHSETDMFSSKSNVSRVPFRNNFKMSKKIRTYKMKKEFIDRLDMDHQTATEIYIEKAFIREVIDNHLTLEAEAVLKWYLYKRVNLSVHKQELGRFQNKLDNMHPDTRRDLRDTAIMALVHTIQLIEEKRPDLVKEINLRKDINNT